MSYPGSQGTNPDEDPGVAATGGYEAPPIEQSSGSEFEAPSAAAPIDYPPPGYYVNPPPTAPGPGYDATGYPGYPPPPDYPTPPPGYPTPPPGYPGSFGPYPTGYAEGYGPPPPAGTNPMAIGALVAAVIGLFCGIGSLIGVVLGFIALHQIKSTGQAGRGLAIGAIVIGCAAVVVGLLWAVLAMSL